ncbi:MAG TPA: hypothetical protein VHP56_10165 [Solirubrobacterales bacterium]|nr:hypothetical protein [Solirubrobacterales bacterium]
MFFDQLAEPDRSRKARRAGADDQEADLDPLVRRVGGRRGRGDSRGG